MEKWPESKPNFYKLETNDDDYIIAIIGNSDLQEEFLNYAQKFKDSALILAEYIVDNPSISILDSYFFAIAFLYRHSLELIMKAIGFKYILDLDDRKEFIKDTFHNLSLIFETITPFIEKYKEKTSDAYNWLDALFKDMNEIDKESDLFRYPFGIVFNGGRFSKQYEIRSFFPKQTHIDLEVFVYKMEYAFDILKNYYSESTNIDEGYKKKKALFLEEGGSYYRQSVIGYSYNQNKFRLHVRAYHECAKYLYERINDNPGKKDSFFIPMCYLYRNSIELIMKEILFEECSYDFQETVKLLKKKKHKVLGLWNSIIGDIEDHMKTRQNDPTIQNVEKYIKQLNDIDGSADKFRYPTNKHLQLHFKKIKKLDIHNVSNFFEELFNFLGAVCLQMSIQNELKAEIELEYYDPYEHFDPRDYY